MVTIIGLFAWDWVCCMFLDGNEEYSDVGGECCVVYDDSTLPAMVIIIIIMVIFKCNFSREHIAVSHKKWYEHRIRKNQQNESTSHDGKSYLK